MKPSEYTRSRARTVTETLVQMFPELRARAFAVQGISDFHRLKRVQDAVARLAEGGDWNKLRGEIAAELGGGDSAAARRRAETVLRTNGFQAYAAARYRKQKASADLFPYWKYTTMDDGRVRDRHAELDGVILPADDPFWKDHYPPWDFNCRCIVIELDEEAAREAVAAGEGSMWDKDMRDRWMADHAGMDAARQFHFRPDSLEMDLRDLAKAEGRTADDMRQFGELMETRRIGTGEIVNNTERTITVREWLWGPVREDYRARVAEYRNNALKEGRPVNEQAWTLDAWTGEELGHKTGTAHSVGMPDIPEDAAERSVRVIHSHPSGSVLISPQDALAATGTRIESIEAITVAGDWRRVRMRVRDEKMQKWLDKWWQDFTTARNTENDDALKELVRAWKTWLARQRGMGYIEIMGN